MFAPSTRTSPSSSRRPRRPRSTYRSARAVRPPAQGVINFSEWTKLKIVILLVATCALAVFMLLPIYLFELTSPLAQQEQQQQQQDATGTINANNNNNHVVGLASLLHQSGQIRKNWKTFVEQEKSLMMKELEQDLPLLFHHAEQQQQQIPLTTAPPPENEKHDEVVVTKHIVVEEQPKQESQQKQQQQHDEQKQQQQQDEQKQQKSQLPKQQQQQQQEDEQKLKEVPQEQEQNLARGVVGLPMSQTPALIGAQRGRIHCDDGYVVDDLELAYWNDPVGTRDLQFVTPLSHQPTEATNLQFLSFEPDPGGWNNVRMSFENMVVLAAATGRTLILPPKSPFYLLGVGTDGARSFGSFLSLPTLQKRISTITMSDFLANHGARVLGLKDEELKQLKPLGDLCLRAAGVPANCDNLWKHFRPVGWQPTFRVREQCLIFDEDVFEGKNITQENLAKAVRFCGVGRVPTYYNATWTHPQLLHWDLTGVDLYRVLDHYYATMYFTNPITDNYMKRLVRDSLHYKDEIQCAAGKIIHAIRKEFPEFSSWHVRHGDFQYKETRISIDDWYNNTKSFLKQGEALYISTDEKNRSFFDPLTAKYGHPVKYMDDYNNVVQLDQLDPTYLGMIETIVASYGRTFTGTWFSTFSGYINRLRGYRGISMTNSWYSYAPRRDWMQKWQYISGNHFAREWPIAWVGIDGDELIEHEIRQDAVESPIKVKPPLNATHAHEEDKKVEPEKEDESDAEPLGRKVPKLTLDMLEQDVDWSKKPVARGISGRPMDQTPAMIGATRAHIECDVNVDSLAYWNDPQGDRDRNFKSPFAVGPQEKYITFAIDRGGWNNVRMSMEIIFIIAFVTGRTLVLPPEIVLYLLNHDTTKHKTRSFADFFPLHTPEFQKRLKIITMPEFLKKEGGPHGLVPLPKGENATTIMNAAEHCEVRAKSERSCFTLNGFLESSAYNPGFRAEDGCVVFDVHAYKEQIMDEESVQSARHFCGKREITYWTQKFNAFPVIHFPANVKKFRMLTHFYSMLHFTDSAIDNTVKRFVRDFLHYHDQIYCAAGKIVKALQYEGKQRTTTNSARAVVVGGADKDGSGGYSAMHVRRGDLQYQKVKLPAELWWNNTLELWKPDEILYIATDERNLSWFNPIASHRRVRFLSDYWEFANLSHLDPNYMGMIDTIVASRGRAFAGTWFSTFSGYINRMRGYHGLSMMDSWYSFLPRKTALHNWTDVDHMAYAYEWPTGWAGIDADVVPRKGKY